MEVSSRTNLSAPFYHNPLSPFLSSANQHSGKEMNHLTCLPDEVVELVIEQTLSDISMRNLAPHTLGTLARVDKRMRRLVFKMKWIWTYVSIDFHTSSSLGISDWEGLQRQVERSEPLPLTIVCTAGFDIAAIQAILTGAWHRVLDLSIEAPWHGVCTLPYAWLTMLRTMHLVSTTPICDQTPAVLSHTPALETLRIQDTASEDFQRRALSALRLPVPSTVTHLTLGLSDPITSEVLLAMLQASALTLQMLSLQANIRGDPAQGTACTFPNLHSLSLLGETFLLLDGKLRAKNLRVLTIGGTNRHLDGAIESHSPFSWLAQFLSASHPTLLTLSLFVVAPEHPGLSTGFLGIHSYLEHLQVLSITIHESSWSIEKPFGGILECLRDYGHVLPRLQCLELSPRPNNHDMAVVREIQSQRPSTKVALIEVDN
ncbi:hypothetical protein K523DRAFT_328707 [Schizophyllum commune Tattone D]|nr:hypothetical protein K523DRAFT_328707 [Schizophyllum commune Tattone D]